jgi:hypothetical protein
LRLGYAPDLETALTAAVAALDALTPSEVGALSLRRAPNGT